MKKRFFLLPAALLVCMIGACGSQKNVNIQPTVIDASNVDDYLLNLPEYDKITVSIERSKFSEELNDDYAERYYEKLAADVEGLRDEEGYLLPLSDESIKLLDITAFSDLNEFKVFIRKTVEEFIAKENDDKKIAAALKIMREEADFAEIPADYIDSFKDGIVSGYDDIAAKYDISANYYVDLSDISLKEKTLEAAQNELIYIKIADRIGLEYSDRDGLYAGVTDYLLSIISVSKK